MPEKDKMELWKSVCETDPHITKPVKYGARQFTAICAQSQLRRATELWGPYGNKWGIYECVWGFVGDPMAPIALTLQAKFVYPGGGIEIASDIPYAPKDECYKKLLTDVTTKALSKLGFNADVFEGKFKLV